ncbi:DNA-binding protein [Frateuria sp. Soil773]|uniref:non-homologous end joining protein Ku n=1 Tax=Frateuria sp. Soil773 TaxID=1736407 RepID=UPI0006F9F421|nr:Ku protein [Frateuria sp. Soil773]KRE88736.1 DNA-binding protein [Frateuria sp. Soil773]
MARPIWTGTLSFGLLNVPIRLMTAERRVDLHFRMLDQRDNSPIRYERVNAESGEEVPWKDVVKAFEYSKGSYVVLDEEDIRSAASESHETVEIDTFVEAGSIDPRYYEKPYYLVPAKKAEKGYVLLRETLAKAGRVGIAKVVIRTREYLAAVVPQGAALLLVLLRYPQELVDASDYALPDKPASSYRIAPRELAMASDLIESMSGEWRPDDYRDEFRDKLRKAIEKRLKSKGVTATVEEDEEHVAEDAATNVVDFMALLKKSIAGKKRTPAKAAKKTAAKKSGAGKGGAGKGAAKKTAAKKDAGAKAARKATRKAAAGRRRTAG